MSNPARADRVRATLGGDYNPAAFRAYELVLSDRMCDNSCPTPPVAPAHFRQWPTSGTSRSREDPT